MGHEQTYILDNEFKDEFELTHKGKSMHHSLSNRKVETERLTPMSNLKDAIHQLKSDDSSFIWNLYRNTLAGAFIGFAMSPTFLYRKFIADLDVTAMWKYKFLFRTNCLKFLRMGFKEMMPFAMKGAGLAFTYSLFYLGFWNKLQFGTEATRIIGGHAIFGGISAVLFTPNHFSKGWVLGMLVGTLMYTDRMRPGAPGQELGPMYLPTEDPVILEARVKALEREIIHAMSLSLLKGQTNAQFMGSQFD